MGDFLQKTTFTEQRIIITETYGQTDPDTAPLGRGNGDGGRAVGHAPVLVTLYNPKFNPHQIRGGLKETIWQK